MCNLHYLHTVCIARRGGAHTARFFRVSIPLKPYRPSTDAPVASGCVQDLRWWSQTSIVVAHSEVGMMWILEHCDVRPRVLLFLMPILGS